MLFRSKKSRDRAVGTVKSTKSWKERAIAKAIENDVEIYEIETFDYYVVKLVYNDGNNELKFEGRRDFDYAYQQACEWMNRRFWKDREEKVV